MLLRRLPVVVVVVVGGGGGGGGGGEVGVSETDYVCVEVGPLVRRTGRDMAQYYQLLQSSLHHGEDTTDYPR